MMAGPVIRFKVRLECIVRDPQTSLQGSTYSDVPKRPWPEPLPLLPMALYISGGSRSKSILSTARTRAPSAHPARPRQSTHAVMVAAAVTRDSHRAVLSLWEELIHSEHYRCLCNVEHPCLGSFLWAARVMLPPVFPHGSTSGARALFCLSYRLFSCFEIIQSS